MGYIEALLAKKTAVYDESNNYIDNSNYEGIRLDNEQVLMATDDLKRWCEIETENRNGVGYFLQRNKHEGIFGVYMDTEHMEGERSWTGPRTIKTQTTINL